MSDSGTTPRADGQPEKGLERLRESDAWYRSVVAAIAEAVTVYDAEGRLIASNPTAAQILGLEPEEYRERVLKDPKWSAYHEDGSEWRAEDYPVFRTLKSGEPTRDQIMGVSRADGELIWISVNTQPIFEPGASRPSLTVATFTDVTARKQTEARLRESEGLYRSLVEHAPIGIGVHQDGRFVYANTQLSAMLGAMGPEEVVGKRALDLVHPDYRAAVAERIKTINEGDGVAPTIEERLLALDGRVLDAEVAGSACTYMGLPGVQVAVLDVTEKKKLERQLLQAQKMEAVGRLASGVAHEFQNLLTAITGYAALAKRTLSPSHPAVQALNRVQEAAEQAAGVTGSLLAFGRRSGGEKSVVLLAEPVEKAARLLRRTLPATVEMVTRQEGPVWVKADANQIQQAVVNLAINARDAMQGMPRGRLELTVGPAPGEGKFAQVRVADTGHGVSPQVRAQMFEPFFTTKPAGEGTGLGLAIVQRIMEDHGGRVEVRTREGGGTEVALLLPCVDPPRDAPSPAAKGPGLGIARTVLLASGARHARELMAGALIDMGCVVVQAADGPSLLKKRGELQGSPGLIVIGADLPGRSGRDCLAELRRAGDRTPAILICDAGGNGGSPDALSSPLVEPFPMSELVAMAAQLMGPPRGVEDRT